MATMGGQGGHVAEEDKLYSAAQFQLQPLVQPITEEDANAGSCMQCRHDEHAGHGFGRGDCISRYYSCRKINPLTMMSFMQVPRQDTMYLYM